MFLIFFLLFYVRRCFACIYVCEPHEHLVPGQSPKEGFESPGTEGLSRAAMCVLGAEPRPSRRTTSALSHRAASPAPPGRV